MDTTASSPSVCLPTSSSSSRLSCTSCRDRKQRCDRAVPVCSRCQKLNHECVYPRSRQSNQGKRTQIRDLEAKLCKSLLGPSAVIQAHWAAELEGRLPPIGSHQAAIPRPSLAIPRSSATSTSHTSVKDASRVQRLQDDGAEFRRWSESVVDPSLHVPEDGCTPATPVSREVAQDLTAVFFEKSYHATPIIHRTRYLTSLQSPPQSQVPLCLQYAVMATAAKVSTPHHGAAKDLYHQARKLAEADEMLDSDEQIITVAHAQTWLLVANMEAQDAMFSRAFVSLGRSIRIAQALHLHQMDKGADGTLLFPTFLKAPRDWIEVEERRRTWWAIYTSDRLVSAVTGLPDAIQDQQVHTLLPASEESFEAGTEERTSTLEDALRNGQVTHSRLASRVLAASLFHRAVNLEHLTTAKRRDGSDRDEGEVTKRHQDIENDIATLIVLLPETLRLPQSSACQQAIFVNVLIYTASLCLHKTAMRRARSDNSAASEFVTRQSQSRAVAAAKQIVAIFQLAQDAPTTFRNPIQNFSAFTAALVFLEDAAAWGNPYSKNSLKFLHGKLREVGEDHVVARMLAAQLRQQSEELEIHLEGAEDEQAPVRMALT